MTSNAKWPSNPVDIFDRLWPTRSTEVEIDHLSVSGGSPTLREISKRMLRDGVVPFAMNDASPIEALFGIAAIPLLAMKLRNEMLRGEPLRSFVSVRTLERLENLNLPKDGITLFNQVRCGPFRVDFMFAGLAASGKRIYVAVECDGHEFHEKTKEQVARDKKRGRELAAMDITVLRFSGAEIWKDPMFCALEAFMLAADRVSSDGNPETNTTAKPTEQS